MTETTERAINVVTFTVETTADYVVNLDTGEIKREASAEDTGEYHYIALFCAGEFAGEGWKQSDFQGTDWDAVNKADQLLEAWQGSQASEAAVDVRAKLCADAIELLTGQELSPSTVDLLTLEGLAVADWIDDDEEFNQIVATILDRYPVNQ